MQSENKHMDIADDFSRKIGEKVKNHTLPVDASVWEGIDSRLPAQKRRLAPWMWIPSCIAVAIIGLLFLLSPFTKQSIDHFVAKDSQLEERTTINQSVESEQNKSSKIVEKEPSKTLFVQKNDRNEALSKRKTSSNTSKTSSVITDYLKKQEEKNTPTVENQAHRDENQDQKPVAKRQEEESTINNDRIDKVEEIHMAENSNTKPERSLLAAINGAVGNAALNFGGNIENAYADSPLGYNDKGDLANSENADQYSTLKPSDYSDIRHLPPVSFSIMTSFPLNKTWSIETGLMYTYMVSRFTRTGNITYRGKQELHYLGVPVNLKATLYQNKNWNVYVLGGGSIEKGIFSLYRQEIEYSNNLTKHTNVRSGIDGVQFSAHTAVGFGYDMNSRIQVFGEPRIIYYFNNNQPMSARTENPFIFGLNGGIKITF